MKKKLEEEKECHCFEGEDCCCGDDCTCGNDCSCTGDCHCGCDCDEDFYDEQYILVGKANDKKTDEVRKYLDSKDVPYNFADITKEDPEMAKEFKEPEIVVIESHIKATISGLKDIKKAFK